MPGDKLYNLKNNQLPLGLLSFSNIRSSNMIYVDKTQLIYKIAIQRSPIFFSRPRRFEKSLLVNTLHSLFKNGTKDFCGLAIEKEWTDKTYHVVHLDFSGFASNDPENFKRGLNRRIINQFSQYKNINLPNNFFDEYPADLLDHITKYFDDNSLVLLVDEYDSPLTHHIQQK